MPDLNLPDAGLRTTERDGKTVVYDPVRQKYVRLTPEERVRQTFLAYLTGVLNVPPGLVAVEQAVDVSGQTQRADLVVFDRHGRPLLLVECKAPDVRIRQKTFDQSARYNAALQAPYLVVTNGIDHYACRIDLDAHDYTFLDDLPDYETLLAKAAS
jgi:hypothetical protein